jgi:anti-sigma factor RsiW
MTISDNVMNDLLTMYLAGDASADTKALVEAHAREHQAFAARLAAAKSFALPEVPRGRSSNDHELRALAATRQFIWLRTMFCASGVLFTLLPLTLKFGSDGVQFLILGREPGLMWSFWSLAAASWTAFIVVNRRIGRVGL